MAEMAEFVSRKVGVDLRNYFVRGFDMYLP